MIDIVYKGNDSHDGCLGRPHHVNQLTYSKNSSGDK